MEEKNFDKDEYITVIFRENEKVKQLGARWDQGKRSWYIPKGKDYRPFTRYYPYTTITGVLSKDFYLLSSRNKCWKCGQVSEVVTFALSNSRVLDEEYESTFDDLDYPIICYSVNNIGRNVYEAIKQYAPFYRFDYSKTVNAYYWMNHCSKCNASMGDFYMHNEPGGAFNPEDDMPYDYMNKRYFSVEFVGNCDYTPISYLKSIKTLQD